MIKRFPKISIRKMFLRNKNNGRFMYYSPFFDNSQALAKIKPKAPVLDLNGSDDGYPDISFIRTEKQLCKFILDNFGVGIFLVTAHLKGKLGLFTFWRGEINSEGFMFYKKEYPQNRELNKLKKELKDTENEEEKSVLYDNIETELMLKEIEKPSRYGFQPFIKTSSRRGTFMFWNDPEVENLDGEQFEKLEDEIPLPNMQSEEELIEEI